MRVLTNTCLRVVAAARCWEGSCTNRKCAVIQSEGSNIARMLERLMGKRLSERVGATVTSWRDRNPRGGESSEGYTELIRRSV